MSSKRQILEQWAKQNPGLFGGLKQAISGAEGTILGGKPGYNVMFGGGKFNDFSRHPDKVIRSPGGY
jgi:muramidase (phage lysozyme)